MTPPPALPPPRRAPSSQTLLSKSTDTAQIYRRMGLRYRMVEVFGRLLGEIRIVVVMGFTCVLAA